jgi:endonuclease YncB( thermonuclease family)
VIDGDTILADLGKKEKVRLLGIDAPEKSPGEQADRQCSQLGVDQAKLQILAKLSQIHLCGLCPVGSTITLQTSGKVHDDYGRLLVGVFIGDECVNRRMVEDGYAMAYAVTSDWEDYSSIERAAREARKGIFAAAESHLTQLPPDPITAPAVITPNGRPFIFQAGKKPRRLAFRPARHVFPIFR